MSVKGITVDDSQNAVWMGTALGGTSAAWATYKFTKNESVTGEWYHDFASVECASYKYNIYVDNKDAFVWNNINAEGSSSTPRTLLVESSSEIKIDATFTKQPDNAKTVDITVNITPTGLTLESWTRVWIWDSKTNLGTGTILTKGAGDVWSVVISKVSVNSTFKVTACLGTVTAIDWAFKSSDVDSMETNVTADTKVISYTATFAGQPSDPDAGHLVTFAVIVTNYTSTFQFPQAVYKKSGDENYTYLNGFKQDAVDKTKFTSSMGGLQNGVYQCHVSLWEVNSPWTQYDYFADAVGTDFTFTISGADITVTLSGAVAVSGGVGTISVA